MMLEGVGDSVKKWDIDWAEVFMECNSWVMQGGCKAYVIKMYRKWGSLPSPLMRIVIFVLSDYMLGMLPISSGT